MNLPPLLRSFDLLTEEGRARERHRRALLTTLASVLAKGISLATALISVPLTFHYLGPERFGLWITLSSVVGMLSFADFGIGNGVLNVVSSAYGRDDWIAIRGYVSSGIFSLSVVAAVVLVVFGLVYDHISWAALFNVSTPQARREVGPALMVMISSFAVTIPLNVVQRVQAALQRGFMASLWQCGASALGLIGVIAAIMVHATLAVLVFALVGAPLAAAALNTAIFFGILEKRLTPRLRNVSQDAMHEIMRIGVMFFIIQLTVSLTYYSDTLFVAHFLGVAAVASYAVPQRLFGSIGVILGMALSPLWPAYGEAIARGDLQWVRRTLERSLSLTVGLSAAIAVVFVFSANLIMRLWLGHSITAPLLLLSGLAVLQVIMVAGGATAAYLNGSNAMRFQVYTGIATALLAVVLKITLIPTMGVAGVVWGTAIAFMSLTIPPTFIVIRRRLWQSA